VSPKAVLFQIHADDMLVAYMVSALMSVHRVANCFIFETAGIFYLMFATFAGVSRFIPFSASRLIHPLSSPRHFHREISLQHRSSWSSLYWDRCRLRFWLRVWIQICWSDIQICNHLISPPKLTGFLKITSSSLFI
jgi:hypothetical protein